MRMTPPETRRDGAFRGVLWLGGGQVVAQVTNLLSRLVLARLLTPEDFGLMALAVMTIAFQDLIAGLGLPAALVQAEELDDRTKSSAFWFTLLQGIAVALLGCSLSAQIAALFDEPELVPVLLVVMGSGAILAPASTLESLFFRDMVFRVVALRRVASKAVDAVLAIGLALAGYGVWALVIGRIAGTVVSFALLYGASPWRPAPVLELRSLRPFLGFSAGVTFGGICHAINRQVPTIVVGRVLGMEALGYLSLAQQVLLLPVQYVARPAAKVLFPTFAGLRSTPQRLRATFARWQFAVMAIAGGIPALVASLAPAGVPVVIGEQWAPGVLTMQIAAIPATTRLAVSTVSALLRGLGRGRAIALWAAAALVLQSTGLVLGVGHGLEAAMLGWSVGNVLTLFVAVYLAADALGTSALGLLRPVASVGIPAALVAAGLLLLQAHVVGPRAGLFELVGLVVLGTGAYLVGLLTFDRAETLRLLRRVTRRSTSEPKDNDR